MVAPIAAFIPGFLFGLGLAVSQMVNPGKVLGFLDVLGDWDPSLALVMVGAIGIAAAGFAITRQRAEPMLGEAFQIPAQRDLDMPLVAGSALFGIGWGMVGLCPGPALTGLVAGRPESVIFVAAMLAGMVLHRLVTARRS